MAVKPDSHTEYEVWFNRALGTGRHQKAATEPDAWTIADTLAAEGHPNIEVLKVTTTRKAIQR